MRANSKSDLCEDLAEVIIPDKLRGIWFTPDQLRTYSKGFGDCFLYYVLERLVERGFLIRSGRNDDMYYFDDDYVIAGIDHDYIDPLQIIYRGVS